MDKRLARLYKDRWRAVAAADLEAERRSSVGQRLQHMDAIYRLALGLGLPEKVSDAGKQAVRERWARLKRHAR